MEIELPELVTLPAFMLVEGDMCYHSEYDWFYQSMYDGSPPGRFNVGRLDGCLSVAKSRASALGYNAERRAALMGDHKGPPGPND